MSRMSGPESFHFFESLFSHLIVNFPSITRATAMVLPQGCGAKGRCSRRSRRSRTPVPLLPLPLPNRDAATRRDSCCSGTSGRNTVGAHPRRPLTRDCIIGKEVGICSMEPAAAPTAAGAKDARRGVCPCEAPPPPAKQLRPLHLPGAQTGARSSVSRTHTLFRTHVQSPRAPCPRKNCRFILIAELAKTRWPS